MKRSIFAIAVLMVTTGAAHAVDLELGAGFSKYNARGNMMWYQEGLPYELDLRAPVIEAGACWKYYPTWSLGS